MISSQWHSGLKLSTVTVSEVEFLWLRSLIIKTSGIDLNHNKKTLLLARLSKRLHARGCYSFSDYIAILKQDTGEVTTMINLITTNVTRFYREPGQFTVLKQHVLPHIMQTQHHAKIKKLRIWSAGCASGEEVYTILLELCDFFGGAIPSDVDCMILGSDIDTHILQAAQRGEYPISELKSVEQSKIGIFFEPAGAHTLRIKADFKKYVQFKAINLVRDRLSFKSPVDIIFCRNVVIYFDDLTKTKIYHAFHRLLNTPGYFFSGHTENLFAHKSMYQFVEKSIYKKVA